LGTKPIKVCLIVWLDLLLGVRSVNPIEIRQLPGGVQREVLLVKTSRGASAKAVQFALFVSAAATVERLRIVVENKPARSAGCVAINVSGLIRTGNDAIGSDDCVELAICGWWRSGGNHFVYCSP
jgi:hypothetical protein